MAEGYSNTPLHKKLGLKDGQTACFVNEPSHFFELFDEMPQVNPVELNSQEIDYAHLFCTSRSELLEFVPAIMKNLLWDGILWVSWPKKTSGITTDIDRDIIREQILKMGLVDLKVCAIDKDWSGLKFVYRLVDRK